jgi:signal transduction histidine kinase
MRASSVPVMSAEPNRTCARPAEVLAQPVAAATALLVLIWALSDGVWPTWPLWTIVGLLALGLIIGSLTRHTGVRSVAACVHCAAAFAALLIISHALPDAHAAWPLSPLWVVALVLGLGLVARPVTRHVTDWSGSALAIAALAAALIFLWTLSVDAHTFLYTLSPRTLRPDNGTEDAAWRTLVDLFSLALVVSALPGHRTVRRGISFVALALALSMIVSVVVSPPSYGLWPLWTYEWAIVALGCGLAVVILPRLFDWPRASALLKRIDELSRTRSGALDVQAAELRRIERDLHDGAQVQLIALSIKLGRAEDRYRDDPVTAALLRDARENAATAIRELRELARGIAPAVLINRGLEAAVRSLAHRSSSEVTVTSRLERRPPPAVERAGYFVVAESLANAAKHAPGSRVEIDLHLSGGDLTVAVTDFGPGGADPAGGGLTGLRQRVEALDGVLNVTSPPAVGTQLEAIMPCGR